MLYLLYALDSTNYIINGHQIVRDLVLAISFKCVVAGGSLVLRLVPRDVCHPVSCDVLQDVSRNVDYV